MTYAWFDVTRNAGIARIMHMSYRSKTYTWNDAILVKISSSSSSGVAILCERSPSPKLSSTFLVAFIYISSSSHPYCLEWAG